MKKLTNWDYETAVSQLKPIVEDLNKKTLKVCKMLYQAREALSNSGYRSDLKNVTPALTDSTLSQMRQGTEVKTFERFCEDVGLTRPTAYRWLASYDPDEDRLLSADEVKERTVAAVNATFEEVREHRYNGEPEWVPEKWSTTLENKYQLWLIKNGFIKLEPQNYHLPEITDRSYIDFGLFSQDYFEHIAQRTYERTSGDNAIAFHSIIQRFEKVVPKGIKPVEVAKISEMAIVCLEQFPAEVRKKIGISLADQIKQQVLEEF